MNKPSETPITPPTITANFEPRGRIRTSGGSSEDTSSARPNLLRGFVATSQSCNRILDEELSTLQSAWSAFRATCSWVTVDTFTLLNGFADYLVECETDAQWIDYIADAFEVAGGVGLLDSVLNGMAVSALVPAMSDQQLLKALKRLDQEQLAKLFESSPALANQLHLIDPVTINEWWHGLTPGGSGQQNTVVHALPQIFGNLEGIPYAARARANQIVLNRDMVGVAKRIETLRERIAWHEQQAPHNVGQNMIPNISLNHRQNDRQWLEQHDDLLARLDELTGLQTTLGELKTLSTKDFGDSTTSLVSYEFGHPPLAAIALGDMDTATQVTYNVPGMGNTTANMREWMTASNNLHESISRSDDAATVAWMDYETPPMPLPLSWNSFDVLVNQRAAVGGERLAESLRGVQAVRADDAPQLNGKAHSYGGPTLAHAITQPGVHVDNVFFVATPGMQSQITHASQLNADNVYAIRIRSTIIGLEDGIGFLPDVDGDNAAWMGRDLSKVRTTDVMAPAFGATSYGSDTGTEDVGLPTTQHGALAGHGEDGAGHYDVDTENLDNVGYALNGELDEMSPYIDKGPTPLQEGLAEVNETIQKLQYAYDEATNPFPVRLPMPEPDGSSPIPIPPVR